MSHLYREHFQYHERRLEQQTLDALLRIEEILARAFPEAPVVEPVKPEPEVKEEKTPAASRFAKRKA